jgi:hypothetical protein
MSRIFVELYLDEDVDVLVILNQVTADEMQNQVRYI